MYNLVIWVVNIIFHAFTTLEKVKINRNINVTYLEGAKKWIYVRITGGLLVKFDLPLSPECPHCRISNFQILNSFNF